MDKHCPLKKFDLRKKPEEWYDCAENACKDNIKWFFIVFGLFNFSVVYIQFSMISDFDPADYFRKHFRIGNEFPEYKAVNDAYDKWKEDQDKKPADNKVDEVTPEKKNESP